MQETLVLAALLKCCQEEEEKETEVCVESFFGLIVQF